MDYSTEDVRAYWDSHLNLTQFLTDERTTIGSDEFYRVLESAMDRYEYKGPLLERFARDSGGQSLLEVGCGLGVELGRLGRLGFRVTGIDLSPKAVALASDYLKRLGVDGEARVQDAEETDFPDGSFDAVYSSGVLQHTPRIERAIAEIHRVLKPGGRILIILYHRHSWFYVLQRLSGVRIEFESDDAPIINTYTRKELRQLFSSFDDLRVTTEYYYPKPTRRRGALPLLFNRGLVPAARLLPRSLMRNFGWHLVLTGRKASGEPTS
jgi:SAM-dependent methyltransferase